MMTKDLNDQGLVLNKQSSFNALYKRVSDRIKQARSNVVKSINTEMVDTYWHIGREIVEEEQKGEERADYGKELIKNLSKQLTRKLGRGFSISTLKDVRQFYLLYKNRISHTVRGQFKNKFDVNLSWAHYVL